MAQNAKNAMAAAASALGNKHESATSQTQSAIGSNIQIDTETPENLTALSRDTQNANHKVKAFDHNEVKEQQEAAQVAGELFAKVTGDLAKNLNLKTAAKRRLRCMPLQVRWQRRCRMAMWRQVPQRERVQSG